MRAFTCIAAIFAIIAIGAAFLGFMFMIASVGDPAQNQLTAYMLFGATAVFIILAILLGYWGQRTPERVVVEAHVDLPGDFDVSQVACPHCGGTPRRENLAYERGIGAVVLTCPFCGKVSQLVEDVKW